MFDANTQPGGTIVNGASSGGAASGSHQGSVELTKRYHFNVPYLKLTDGDGSVASETGDGSERPIEYFDIVVRATGSSPSNGVRPPADLPPLGPDSILRQRYDDSRSTFAFMYRVIRTDLERDETADFALRFVRNEKVKSPFGMNP